LQFIDYVFGDDKKAADVLGEELADKYESVSATMEVGGELLAVERYWRGTNSPTRIRVNGEWVTIHNYSLHLLDLLGIPVLHYPQGNPYGPRAWPELGWRSLLRHVYRRQSSWGDLAERQPESEQHACILQFLGLAELVFSGQYGSRVALEKRIAELRATREQFIRMLQEVSREVLDKSDLEVALSPAMIESSVDRLQRAILETQKKRNAVLVSLRESVSGTRSGPGGENIHGDDIDSKARELEECRTRRDAVVSALNAARRKQGELQAHRDLVNSEKSRMERARESGAILAELRITHCPACDKPVEKRPVGDRSCVLCGRPVEDENIAESKSRLDFELQQLEAESKESEQLVNTIAEDVQRLDNEVQDLSMATAKIEADLRPVRTAAAAILPPELTLYDQETGRLEERIGQLRRVKNAFDKRDTLAVEIERVQQEVDLLEQVLAQQARSINFETAGDLLTDGMNEYIELIRSIKDGAWSQKEIGVVLHERSFAARVGTHSWQSQLGVTMRLLFMIAYHYSLLRLTGKPGCHYPGLCILDFPGRLDNVDISGTEAFALEPFVAASTDDPKNSWQVIAAGNSFAGMSGVNRIELKTIWT
jgi:hypothetical protein